MTDHVDNIKRVEKITNALSVVKSTKESWDKATKDLESAEETVIDQRERVRIIQEDHLKSLDDLHFLLNDANREASL